MTRERGRYGAAPARPPARRPAHGSALVIAVLLVALAGAAAAALSELGRESLVRARLDRDGVRAWFLAEEGLAETVTALAVGTDFTARLSPGPAPEPPAWGYGVEIRDDADETPPDPTRDANQRVLVRVTARGVGEVRRRLEAVVGRAVDPYFPAAATVAGGVKDLTGDFRLDGRDKAIGSACTMAGNGRTKAGVAMADDATDPVLAHPDQIVGSGPTPSLVRGAAPDLTALARDARATHLAPGLVGGGLGSVDAPQLTVVDGDATIDASVTGAGILYVDGHLRITGALGFSGVVAAAGGVEVPPAGRLDVCGGLWTAGPAALDLRGNGSINASADALRMASTLAPLPAAARVIAVRELF